LPKIWASERIAAALLGIALSFATVAAPAPAAARELTLTLDESRLLAQRALIRGDFLLARQLAEVLLRADADDRAALMIVAATEPALGRPQAGFRAGRRAFRLSDSAVARYRAARLTARAAFAAGWFGRAEFWLRRAAIHAGSQADKARTARDYRIVRAKNPLSVDLRFSVAHSENVNGGSSASLSTVDGLPDVVGSFSGAARALSGTVGWVEADLGYTLSESARRRTRIAALVYLRGVTLSQEARDLAPEAQGSDFAAQVYELNAEHRRLLGAGRDELSMTAALGQEFFGGDLSSRYARLGFGLQHRLDERHLIGLDLSAEASRLGNSGDDDRMLLRLTASDARIFGDGSRLDLKLRASHTASDRDIDRGYGFEAQASYRLGRPVGPLRLAVTLGAGYARFPQFNIGEVIFPPGGRSDRSLYGSVDLTWDGFGYAGFVPVLSLTASHADSNVSRFDRDDLALQIGWRSAF
jgi:hypothetical protein